jgi:ribosomal protein S18 acetylase RimI-like enzyme
MSVFVIRPSRRDDAAAIARINVASWKRTYRGIVPAAYLDALDPAERERSMRERLENLSVGAGSPLSCGFVAVDEDAGEVVGYVTGGAPRPLLSGELPGDFESEIYALYLTPGYERRGLGARLVHAAAASLHAAGARSLIIWALAQNPNRGFYEALGGVAAFEQTLTFNGEGVVEVAFGWDDLAALVIRTTPRG